MKRPRMLSELAPFNRKEDCLRAVIETPKGSSNKYDYDPELGAFELAKTLPEGMAFPFDFGFFPSTVGDDGDPLDVLVLMDFPAVTGSVVNVRVIGCLQAEQKENHKKAVRNDRFLAVAQDSRMLSEVKTLSDLRAGLMDEIKEFFVQYNKLEGKHFEPLGDCAADKALRLIKAGIKKAQEKK
jgi:inorganic pyrophosphatase